MTGKPHTVTRLPPSSLSPAPRFPPSHKHRVPARPSSSPIRARKTPFPFRFRGLVPHGHTRRQQCASSPWSSSPRRRWRRRSFRSSGRRRRSATARPARAHPQSTSRLRWTPPTCGAPWPASSRCSATPPVRSPSTST
jgi:hypothetical protein